MRLMGGSGLLKGKSNGGCERHGHCSHSLDSAVQVSLPYLISDERNKRCYKNFVG